MTVRTETPDDTTVVATVTVEATPERVFTAFTDPAELTAWFWPQRLGPAYRIDLREGGEFKIRSDVADMGAHGQYLQVRPPTRLAMTWQWDGEPERSQVLVELAPAGEGTLVTLTHSHNATVEARDAHDQGWRDCLARLESY